MPDKNLKKRTFDFGISVAKLVKEMPYDFVNRHYFAQLIRSSSSVEANYRAAQRAKSGNDFINKLKIAEEEVDESIYFLEILEELNPQFSNNIKPLISEGTELLKIIVASLVIVRNRISNNKK